MKWRGWMAVLALVVAAPWVVATSPGGEPMDGVFAPAGWRLDDRAAVIEIVEGTRRVRLQALAADGETWETWETVALAHLDGRAGFFKLRIPDGVALGDVRVEVSSHDPFPYSFYQGETTFSQSAATSNAGDGRFLLDGNAVNDAAAVPETGAEPAVEESDIWKWRDRTLYFFNSFRGLQVFDFADLAAPRLEAMLRMPAVGEQMYLVGDGHVVLLANDPQAGWSSGAAGSEIVLVRHEGDSLAATHRFPVEGALVESRLVGGRLLVVTRVWEQFHDDGGTWRVRSGVHVHAIDLTDPANPVAAEPLVLSDVSGNHYWFEAVVAATPEFLFVAPSAYDEGERRWRTDLVLIGIADPDAPLAIDATVPLRGRLNDKFKLRLDGKGILTTVSHAGARTGEPALTVVETFDVSGVAASAGEAGRPVRLDAVSLAPGESVHATRFDGDRLYVVTFLQIDPLYLIDLTDPRRLVVEGELEIPGWSTYLEPLGPRLLSVGVEDRRVAVSLFDVSDGESLAMLERVYLGGEEGYSWSEANYDEKAVGWFAENGLLVLPFAGYEDGAYRNRMQLIDVHDDTLVKRGVIDAEFNARRSRLFDGETLVVVSGHELEVVDVSDRDAPRVVANVEIAWPAEHVVSIGGFLAQFEHGAASWWDSSGSVPVTLRVTPVDDPDAVVAAVEVGGGGQVAGVVAAGRIVHLLTTRTEGREVVDEGADETRWEYQSVLESHVIDLTDPRDPVVRGSAEVRLVDRWFYGSFEGRFLPDGELVWVPEAFRSGGWWWRCLACDFGGVGVGLVADVALPGRGLWWGFGGDRHVVVIDAADPAKPEVLSHFELIEPMADGQINLMDSSAVVLEGATLTFGYRRGEWIDTEHYENRYFVQEIGLEDPAAPVRRGAVGVPGLLVHLLPSGDGGAVLFTTRQKVETDDDGRRLWSGTEVLEASAFDGVQAFLLDAVEVPDGVHTPVAGSGRHLFKPTQGASWVPAPTDAAGLLVWEWSGRTGRLEERPAVALPATPHTLSAREGLVFAFRNGGVDVVDTGRLPVGTRVVSHDTPALAWFWNAPPFDLGTGSAAAFLALGTYGVETIDLSDPDEAVIGSVIPILAAAEADEVEPEWSAVAVDGWRLVSAGAADFVGSLDPGLAWRFQPVGEPIAYPAWAEATFNPDGDPGFVTPLPGGDSDGDGIPDGVEFALGGAAHDPAVRPFTGFAVATTEAGGSAMVLTVLPDPSVAGVTLHPEVSDDLITWTEAGDAHAAGVRIIEDPPFLRVVVPVASPDSGAAAGRFVRLRVTVEP